MKRILRVAVIAGLCCLFACNSPDYSTGSDLPVDSLQRAQIAKNSIEMALFYSGEYQAPERLVTQIEIELSKIFHRYQLNETFRPPWYDHGVYLQFDSATEAQTLAGENIEWNQLLKKYNLTIRTYRFSDTSFRWPTTFSLTARELVHPTLLAERVKGENLSGLTSMWLHGMIYPIPGNVARLSTTASSKYFFMRVTCPDIWFSYRYVEIRDMFVIDHGYFNECAPDSLEIWKLPYAEVQRILDSIEASRPAWVDTARIELRKLERPLTY